MADISLKVELTEQNQSGPFYNAYWTLNCASGSYTASVESPIYLPTVGSTEIITVDENYECIKLESIGVCTNDLVSGSTTTSTTTTSTTTTTTTTTTSTTTTTTTTTTLACTEWDLECPSNASGDCEFTVDCCDGTVADYSISPDSSAIACVIAGGTVTVNTVSGLASETSPEVECSSLCGDVTTTTSTSTTTTSTTTTTTSTTTIGPSNCIAYDLDCPVGAVGGNCTFQYTNCTGSVITPSLSAGTSLDICALDNSVSVTSTSGTFTKGTQCYYGPYTLEYGSVSPATVCANFGSNPSGSFYFDVPNFSITAYIYTDLLGTGAPAFFYTDGVEVATVGSGGQVTARTGC